VAPRDTRIALVPCGHQRFCELRANEVHNQRGCPLCRTPINVLLRLHQLDLRVNLCLKITLREAVTKIAFDI